MLNMNIFGPRIKEINKLYHQNEENCSAFR